MTTERSEVVRALETKFLRFCTGQERDGVLSLFAFGWLRSPPGLWRPWPSFSAAASRRRGSVCRRRFLCGQVERWGPAGSGELHSLLLRAGQPADVFRPRRVPRLSRDPGQRTNVLYTHHPSSSFSLRFCRNMIFLMVSALMPVRPWTSGTVISGFVASSSWISRALLV